MFSDATLFRYAAASYLRSWIALDSRFVTFFNGVLTTAQLAGLLREYKAIRNFKKTHPKDGHQRLQLFVDVLAKAKVETDRANAIDPVKMVNRINNEIIPHYKARHKNFVSAASKTCWMIFRHPVAIYDSLVCKALWGLGYNFDSNDYDNFYVAWTGYYEKKRQLIEGASVWVVTSDYARRLIDHRAATQQEIAEWAASDWFKNRICDQRLVLLGGKDHLETADLAAYLSLNELAP